LKIITALEGHSAMRTSLTHNHGFTLLEVLIAVVVLSIGLLGIAGLQAVGQQSNHSAYLRSQATVLAYDMIDRMRANQAAVANGDYDSIDTTANNYADPGCAGAGCSSSQMAQYDMYDWQQELSTQLPTGNGKVVGAGSGSIFTVTVMWDDDRNGSANLVCGNGTLKCFAVSSRL
jgi:type IV pilus assembly protein PilV